jgi:hypothetical protein
MPLALAKGALFVELTMDQLLVFPLAGAVSLGTTTETLDLRALLWSDEGPIVPEQAPPFPPLSYLEPLPQAEDRCLLAASVANVSLVSWSEPDANADASAALDSSGTYPAVQRSSDGAWLRLADAYGAGWLRVDAVTTWGACESLPEQAVVTVLGAGLAPDQIMMSYLQARVTGDRATMSALACDAFQGQVALQAQSFRAMRAELLGVTCTATQQDGSSAVVVCSGSIQTNYNGELRQWPPGAYTMRLQNDAWRVCGEAN